MPRNYQKKGSYQKYSYEDMEKALTLVNDENKSVYYASKETGVPYETLRRCLHDASNIVIGKAGRRPVLSMEEEEQLIVALEYSARCGYPQDRDDVAEMVKTFLDTLGRKTPFHNNRPGKDWMITFVRRHEDTLRPHKPELLTKARSDGLSELVVTMFFIACWKRKLEKRTLHQRVFTT